MFRPIRVAGLLWATSIVAACTGDGPTPTPAETRTADQTVVYGEDSRLDWYAHPDEGLRDLTTNAIVAMIDASDLDDSDPNDLRIQGRTLAQAYNLCEDERFRDHPTGASCSGTLIDDNLVLTAGHCISERNCGSRLWVFDYYYAEEGQLETIGPDDVYACSRLVASSSGGGGGWGGGGSDPDYAIVELDRPVVGRTPAVFAPVQWPVENGDRVSMIGFGSGIPAKLDDGGVVLDDNRQDDQNEFRATVDAFGGNSGSGVFNEDYEVVGILVSGETDYENAGRCTRVATLPESGGPQGGEAVTYAWLAVQELCDEGYPSARLCNIEAICGDGICNNDETWETCPEDCEAPVFIDPDWDCDEAFYGTGDGCDCECGAYDPDCDDPRQQVFNCVEGEFCNADGECASDDEPVEPEPEPAVPADWACDADYYDAGDGCDCVCGTYDPDCDDPTQEVYNCLATQTCDENGECADPEPVEPEPGPDAGLGEDVGGGVDGPDAGTEPGTVDEIFRDGTSGTGCAAAPADAPTGASLLLLGLLGLRRRASRRDA